jgi:hypothetical protein
VITIKFRLWAIETTKSPSDGVELGDCVRVPQVSKFVRGNGYMERRAVRTGGLKWVWNGSFAGGIAIGWLASGSFFASSALGQSTEQVFGANIHRYYEGQYEPLIAEVSAIVNDDLEDPRVYYLRGLAFLKTGQEQAAADDLRKGAELEAIQYGKRNYNIARTMQRIQGNDRAMLEAARSEAMKRRSELRSAKAGIPRSQILAEMGRSILDPPPVPTTSRPNLPDPSSLSDSTAPFGDGWDNAPRPRPAPTTQPAPNANEAVQPAVDPFGGSDAPAPGGTTAPGTVETDPFGEPADRGSTTPAENDDPFAQPTGNNDPFAEPTKPSPPPKTDGAGDVARGAVGGGNVNGGRVLGKLFGALTSPIRRAAEQGANAMQNVPGIGMGAGAPPSGAFPEGPPTELSGNSADPVGGR